LALAKMSCTTYSRSHYAGQAAGIGPFSRAEKALEEQHSSGCSQSVS
jgi:hypothetical protein